MNNENILKEVVGLVPRKSTLGDGTEAVSLILSSLVTYKPIVLMSETEEENLKILEKDIINRVEFLLDFCKNNIMFSEDTHNSLSKVFEKEIKEFDSFLVMCKNLSKEGKVLNLEITLEYIHGYSILICSIKIQEKIIFIKEFKSCVS